MMCDRCNGTGEIAVRIAYPMSYVGPGPVPDDARGICSATCDRCRCMGMTDADLEDDA